MHHKMAYALVIVTVLLGRAAMADDPPPPPPTTSVYDIRDIVADIPDFTGTTTPLSPTELYPSQPTTSPHSGDVVMFSGADTEAATDDRVTRKERTDQIIKLIQDTIQPESWKDCGGDIGSIRELRGRLIITNSVDNHRQVAMLLEELRKGNAETITIEADWIVIAPDDLKDLLKKPTGNEPASLPREVDGDVLKQMRGKAPNSHAEISCLNSQGIEMISGRMRSALIDLEPVVGNSAAAFKPTTSMILSGARLRIRPLVQGDHAIVHVQTVVCDWDKADGVMHVNSEVAASTTRPADDTLKLSTNEMQRVDGSASHFATSLKMPLNRPVLVGGMTVDPRAKTQDNKRIYLVLTIGTQK
ncbi:MAG TPA: hypothetical protein VIL86_16930 [Tepidisphaeraceae bacterium]|jgi:hypothetical protein